MNPGNPLVSIIAICYNQERYVEETLNSIFNQTYSNLELIIIDSNSKDNSVNIIQDWLQRKKVRGCFIRRETDKNVCENANDGLAKASGKYYQILSCDDILMPDKIARQVSIMERNPNAGMVFGNAEKIDENSNLIGQTYYKDEVISEYATKNLLTEEIKKTNFIPAPSVLVRRKCYLEIGRYDESIGYEDWDLWIRIAYSNWMIFHESGIFSNYRVLDHSLWSANNYRPLISTIKLFKKHKLLNYSSAILTYMDYFKYLKKNARKEVEQYLNTTNQYKLLMVYKIHRISLRNGFLNRLHRYKVLEVLYKYFYLN